jgi:hypothetical protein
MIINGTFGQRRYFSDGTRLVHVSSSAGKSYQLGTGWFVAIGSTLLAVDTN